MVRVCLMLVIVVFVGCLRLSLFIICWKCLWFFVWLMVFGDVFIMGMLVVFNVWVSFSGVWLLYCMMMFFGFFFLIILRIFLRVIGLKYK